MERGPRPRTDESLYASCAHDRRRIAREAGPAFHKKGIKIGGEAPCGLTPFAGIYCPSMKALPSPVSNSYAFEVHASVSCRSPSPGWSMPMRPFSFLVSALASHVRQDRGRAQPSGLELGPQELGFQELGSQEISPGAAIICAAPGRNGARSILLARHNGLAIADRAVSRFVAATDHHATVAYSLKLDSWSRPSFPIAAIASATLAFA